MLIKPQTILCICPIACFADVAQSQDIVPIACKFDRLPVMLMIIRGGMGAKDNTLQIGSSPPVPLSVGSSLMLASSGAQEFTFSLRLPATVTVSAAGNDQQTFDGECVSGLPH
jgi:hypothetical protein